MATARNLLMKLAADVTDYNKKMSESANSAKILNKELELTNLRNNENKNSFKSISAQIEATSRVQSTYNDRIKLTQSMVEKMTTTYGSGSSQVQKYTNKLLDLQIASEKLGKVKVEPAISGIKTPNVLGNIAQNAIGYATGQLMFAGAQQAQNAVGSGINYLDTIQQSTIAFTTMTKSASEANKMVSNLWDMAKNTPFEFPDLLETSKRLIAFKFDLKEIPGLLTAVGDASSGLGLGAEGMSRISLALGQMLAKQKVSGDEMKQLTEAGVNGWDYLAKATGKSTAEVMKLSEKGLLPAKESIAVIVKGMEKDFGGMMDKQAKTYTGMMSTLKDSTNEAFGTVMKPAFNELTNTILPIAIQKINEFTDGFKSGGLKGGLNSLLGADNAKGIITVLDSLSAMGSVAGNALSGVAGPVTSITKAILEWKPLIPVVLGVVTAMSAMSVAQSVTPTVLTLGNVIKNFYLTVAQGGTVLQGFGAAMGTIMGPAGWVALGIGAVVGLTTAIVAYNKQQDEMARKTIEAGNSALDAMSKNQELINKYVKLKSEAGESAQKTAELDSITQQLSNTIPGATAVINDQTMALLKQKSALDQLNQANRDTIEAGYLSASANIGKEKTQLQSAKDKEAFFRKMQQSNSWEDMGYKSYGDYQKDYYKYVDTWEGITSTLNPLGQGKINNSHAKDLLSKAITERQAVEEQVNASQKLIDNWDKINKKTFAPWGGGAPESSYGYSSGADPNYRPPDDAFKQVEKIGSAGDSAAKALEEAMAKMQATSTKAENQFINTMKSFFQQMNSMRDSIASFGSMFEKTTYEHFSPEKIKNRLNQTLKEIEKWRKNLAELTSKGVDEYTMNQLRSLGMSGSGIVAGLNKSSMADLRQSLNSMALIRQGAGAEAYTGTVYKMQHEIKGKIDVYGIDSEGQINAVKSIVEQSLNSDKSRFNIDADTLKRLK